jgi:isoleucyl-tRNA synthetase
MKGEEMHKSLGNAIWFDDAADRMGAEAMRWLFCRQNPFTNLNFGYQAAEEPLRHLTTLWNTCKFFVTYARIDGWSPDGEQIPYGKLEVMDRWILARLNQLITEARRSLDNFTVMNLVRAAETFIDDLSNWYVRRCRDRFRQMDAEGDPAAYQTLYTALTASIRLLAPVVPMFTEELYQTLVAWRSGEPESVHLTPYPDAVSEWADEALVEQMGLARQVVEVALAARNAAHVKIRQPLEAMTVVVGARAAPVVEANRRIIADELNVKRVVVTDTADGLTRYAAKPNFRVLGPRFGKSANAVAAELRSLGQDKLGRLAAGERITLLIEGKEETFGPDEVEVPTVSPDGIVMASDGPVTVALDTRLTEELLDEGFAREIVNKVQTMRREAGYNVSDRIEIGYEVGPRLERAIGAFRAYIQGETLALAMKPLDGAWDLRSQWHINTETAELAVRRVARPARG